MTSISLAASGDDWLACVLNNFDEFLIDHAANERKASSMAMSMVAHYPDKPALVREMVNLALEELTHFKQVMRLMEKRGLIMTPDEKDPYVNGLRKHINKAGKDFSGKETDWYFLDRLLSGAVIEARGEERFRRIAEGVADADLKAFYTALANSERGHHKLFIELADVYFEHDQIEPRLNEWITIESDVIQHLPIRPRLH